MKISWSSNAWNDYTTFYEEGSNKALRRKLNKLIKECTRTPYTGTGKPEGLKNDLSGWYSRHINDEHRLVYRVSENGATLEILTCTLHYD